MKHKIEQFLLSPVYPFLFGIYPILVLYSSNIFQVSFSVLLRPLFLSILFALLISVWMRQFFHDWHKSALISTLIILSFSTYGHIENFLISKNIKGSPFNIFAAWFILIILFLVIKKRINFDFDASRIAPSLNLMAIILLLFPLIKGIQYGIVSSINFSSENKDNKPLLVSNLETLPDIYYIIPDGYARSDILKDAYDYDNSGFVAKLESLGFYVSECSQSNYPTTVLSLTSSLNLDYIQNLNEKFSPKERDLFYLFATLQNNSLKKLFNDAGYTTIAFASGFAWAEMKNFDIYLSPPNGPINEFEVLFLKTTLFRLLNDMGIINLDDISAERFRERTRLVFNSLSEIANIPGPKFIFVHVIAPHPPYALDANGKPIDPNNVNDREGYINQANYVSKKILESVEILISQSDTPPIIIIQGDHGLFNSNTNQRFGILNAYYLPGFAGNIDPRITPVNTFRFIFNHYFGTDYQLLPDISYNSEIPYLYNFSSVENDCVSKKGNP